MSKKELRKHTASFLVTQFIWSEKRKTLDIKANDISLLRLIGDLLDQKYKLTDGFPCCDFNVKKLSHIAGVEYKAARKAIKKLLDLKLIILVKKRRNNVKVYALGPGIVVRSF